MHLAVVLEYAFALMIPAMEPLSLPPSLSHRYTALMITARNLFYIYIYTPIILQFKEKETINI